MLAVFWAVSVSWTCLTFCDVFSVQKQKSEADKATLRKDLSCVVQDAHTALTDLRSGNAEQAFRRALALMETTTPKVTNTSLLRSWCDNSNQVLCK